MSTQYEKYSIFKLCEYGFSDTLVIQMYQKGFTINKIKNMDEDEFSSYYSKNKTSLYRKVIQTIYKYDDLNLEEISIYSLLIKGLSMTNIKKCVENNISLKDLKNLSEDDLIDVYNISKSNSKKIIDATKKFYFEEFNLKLKNTYTDKKLKNIINSIIKNSLYPIDSQQILDCINSNLEYEKISIEKVKNIICELQEQKDIEYYSNGYIEYLMDLKEFINNIKDNKKKSMLEMRLNGKTLEEIGIKYGLSRERVRQITSKMLLENNFKEDRYKYYFEMYNFDDNYFTKTFNVDSMVFNYLDIKYKLGKKTINDLLDDENIDIKYKKNLEKEIFKDCIFDGKEYIHKNPKEILEYILKKYCTNQTHIKKIYNLYNEFIENYINEDRESFYINQRALEGRMDNYSITIASVGKKYRYYNYEQYDFNILKQKIDLSCYKDKMISSRKIFLDYPEIMEEYDILDEYELHNILKRVYNDDELITFGRMPTIKFGECDFNMQILDLIIEMAPVRSEDLIDKIEELYGFKKDTIKANFLKECNMYLNDDTYYIDYNILDFNQISLLKKYLNKDIYSIDEFKKIFFNKLFSNDKTLFNIYNLKSLGFDISGNCIYLDKYNNICDAYKNILLRSDFLNLEEIDKQVRSNQMFFRILDDIRNNLDLIEISTNKYINIKRLEKVNIYKNNLEDYRKAVELIADRYEIFTLKYINRKGFYHDIYEYGFDNIFYESLIRGSEQIRYRIVGKSMIFKKGKESIKFSDLCEQIINQSGKMDVYEFKELLLDDYGIDVQLTKLKSVLESSNLYYSKIMEKIYIDYEEYFEEIWQDE